MTLKKNIFVTLVSSVLLVVCAIFVYLPVIFQEGNPWPQLKGIVQLYTSDSGIVLLSNKKHTYITKNSNGLEKVDLYLKSKGYELVEQMGSGYFYKSSNSSMIITRRQFSRFYLIWTFPDSL